VEYINHDGDLYKDTKWVQTAMPGLSLTEIWVKGKLGCVTEPKVLSGLAAFQQSLEADPQVGDVISPITILRTARYVGGQGDTFPTDPEAVDQLATEFEGLIPREPLLQSFVDQGALTQTHLAVITRATEHEAFQKLNADINAKWKQAAEKHPELK